jgi:hypothetical protein
MKRAHFPKDSSYCLSKRKDGQFFADWFCSLSSLSLSLSQQLLACLLSVVAKVLSLSLSLSLAQRCSLLSGGIAKLLSVAISSLSSEESCFVRFL